MLILPVLFCVSPVGFDVGGDVDAGGVCPSLRCLEFLLHLFRHRPREA